MACAYLAVIGSYSKEEFPFVVKIPMLAIAERGTEIVEWMETDEAAGRYVSMRNESRLGFNIAFSDLPTATAFRLRFG